MSWGPGPRGTSPMQQSSEAPQDTRAFTTARTACTQYCTMPGHRWAEKVCEKCAGFCPMRYSLQESAHGQAIL